MPIDLELGDLRVLVVSGPNTGGKTVALKTLGLAALLHQAGLRPPALEAALPVFDDVLADVGDEQSIEMSLSTFSAHLRNIVAILDAATERSLVLLDELAAGTDPVEGSALAQALLARLARQARLTLVTTHYPELKEWASATDGVANAATGFDPETHAPLYRIALGRAGTSHALRIAERLGLDRGRRRRRARAHRAGAAADGGAARRGRGGRAAGRRGARRGRASSAPRREAAPRAPTSARPSWRPRSSASAPRPSARARRRSPRPSASSPRRAPSSRRCARRSAPPAAASASGARPAAAPRAERERDRRLGAASERAARAEQALRALRPPPQTAPLAAGDPVEAPDAASAARSPRSRATTAEVLGPGGLARAHPARAAAPVAPLPRAGAAPEPAVRVLASARGDVSDELDVRGMRAQEAREAVRAFVDDAALAGLKTVRVVHGRGTGAAPHRRPRGAARAPARRAPRARLRRRRVRRSPPLTPRPGRPRIPRSRDDREAVALDTRDRARAWAFEIRRL